MEMPGLRGVVMDSCFGDVSSEEGKVREKGGVEMKQGWVIHACSYGVKR